MDEISITMRELDQIITQTVRRTLEETGRISKYVSRTEIIDKIGRALYDKGVFNGYLNPVKNGNNNAKIRILRSELELWESLIKV
jgi:hypothetical protein